ncbi:MAG: tRNA modification GTPase, partial [Bizionia sp.]|nr:tRNA modification GTPase [Bizionia sp.]
MKKYLLCLLVTIFSLTGYAQIDFEKGYYIDNANQKIECLVKNVDWKNNPTEFEYKLSETSEPKVATIEAIKEFGVYDVSKYVRSKTNIDRSSKNIKYLTTNKNPEFQEELLLLKVLIEDDAVLYEYVEGDLRRYFYSKGESTIDQLIFKSYITSGQHIGTNYRFRQQLFTDLNCPNFEKNRFKYIGYNKSDLVKFFLDYSKCSNGESSTLVNFEEKQKTDVFNLTLRPRFNSSTLQIKNTGSNSRNFEFDNESGLAIGIEAEYILPFNKNKWAIAIEPTYQSFKSEKTIEALNVSGGTLRATVDYTSIEVPLTVRHYLFLNEQSKLFLNVFFVLDFSSSPEIELKRADDSNLTTLKIETNNNFGLGMGYKSQDTFSVELRYQFSRDLTGSDKFWEADYN